MADFFSDLGSGIRLPATQINQGSNPLPGSPYTSFDGQINAGSELLGGITPYGGAKGLPMGSDRNYQHIPHRSQQIIPPLYLPHADLKEPRKVKVSHAVDMGDIAFVLLTDRVQNLILGDKLPGPKSHAPGRNAFCNLVTVNYLLAGLQRLSKSDRPRQCNWAQLADDFGYQYAASKASKMSLEESRDAVLELISQRILPFGICAGSEKQGGLHETGLAPVQAAVNHVTTMTVDGQNRDLVNYWRGIGLSRGGRGGFSAGDHLIFRLELLPTKSFTLNHYYKETTSAIFPGAAEKVWQLVPDKFEMDQERNESYKMFKKEHGDLYDYRLDGYWRIGQSFQHRQAHDGQVENYSNDMCFMRGQLLQVTFAPVWVQNRKRKRAVLKDVVASAPAEKVVGEKRKSGGSFGWDSDDDDSGKVAVKRVASAMPAPGVGAVPVREFRESGPVTSSEPPASFMVDVQAVRESMSGKAALNTTAEAAVESVSLGESPPTDALAEPAKAKRAKVVPVRTKMISVPEEEENEKESFMVDVGGVKEAMTAAVAKTKVTVRKAMGGAK